MISYEVEFPTQKSFSLKVNSHSSIDGLELKTIEAIGGEVRVHVGNQKLATVSYRENITPDFSLSGYKQRAKEHAEAVIKALLEAAREQTAVNIHSNGVIKNASSLPR